MITRYIFKASLSFFNVQEQGMKFLLGKILENIDAVRHYDAFFSDKHASICYFSSVIVLGFENCTVKFTIISFADIIRNVIEFDMFLYVKLFYNMTISM